MIIIISLFYIISYHAFININHNYYHHNIIIYHSIKNNNKNNNNNNVGIDSYITPRVRKQSKRDKTFVNILDSINYNRASSSSASSSSSSLIENNIDNIKNDPLIPLVEKIVKAADMRKSASISAIRVKMLTEVTQFMILVEGFNNRQNQAIALAIEDDVVDGFQMKPYTKEGTAASGWILLDYGSVITHIMTPQMKNFYKLEKRWIGGEVLDLSYLLSKDSASSSIISDTNTNIQQVVDEDAAFWGDDFVNEANIITNTETDLEEEIISNNNHDDDEDNDNSYFFFMI